MNFEAYTVMSFGLKNGPPSFLKTTYKTFEPYLIDFIRVFLDDFSVCGRKDHHIYIISSCA